MKYTITLPQHHVLAILELLSHGAYRQVAEIISLIQSQVAVQDAANALVLKEPQNAQAVAKT